MSAFFPLPRCGMGEGSHVMKSARGFLQFIKVEHVAVHKKSQNNVSVARPFYQNSLFPDTWWFRSRKRIKIKKQVFKISKQRAYFDCIWLTPIGQAEPRDKAISQGIDWASDLNNFRRNPFLIEEVIQKGCLAVVSVLTRSNSNVAILQVTIAVSLSLMSHIFPANIAHASMTSAHCQWECENQQHFFPPQDN